MYVFMYVCMYVCMCVCVCVCVCMYVCMARVDIEVGGGGELGGGGYNSLIPLQDILNILSLLL